VGVEGSDQSRRHRTPQFRHSEHPTHGADAVVGTTWGQPKRGSYLVDGGVGEGAEVTPIRGQLELHRPSSDRGDEFLIGAMSDPGGDAVPGSNEDDPAGAGCAGEWAILGSNQ
jgi:hypothetical protein